MLKHFQTARELALDKDFYVKILDDYEQFTDKLITTIREQKKVLKNKQRMVKCNQAQK